jgi:thymidylate synthase ThyX
VDRGGTYNASVQSPQIDYFRETFTAEEEALLRRYFTNVDRPVFALKNLPEVVKGALFARYSRSAKSLRRLFLDEFAGDRGLAMQGLAAGETPEVPEALGAPEIGRGRAAALYQRIFSEYGDDSVAQLGGAHLACEQASNVLTKALEWGRLAAYLEQSTRYIYFDQKLGGRYRYLTPPELVGTSAEGAFVATMDALFDLYSTLARKLEEEYGRRLPRADGDSPLVRKQTIRARVCDELRGLLPAATVSNVGIFGSGQAYEALLLRMRAHPLAEVRQVSDLLLHELEQVLPDFVRRVEVPDRGVAWTRYLRSTAAAIAAVAAEVCDQPAAPRPAVTLVDWDPEGELKTIAAALYGPSALPDDQLLELVRRMPPADRERIFWAYVGERGNRRHKPGRALERTSYRFDLVADYGAFRDLQRHRMLTLEWQRLSPHLGHVEPPAIAEMGWTAEWQRAMAGAAALYETLHAGFGPEVAQYAVPFAYKVRFFLQLNAREAFHVLELRSQQGGHEAYRELCQEMHRQIAEKAGHRLLAAAMKYVDHQDYEFGRLASARRAESRRETTTLRNE